MAKQLSFITKKKKKSSRRSHFQQPLLKKDAAAKQLIQTNIMHMTQALRNAYRVFDRFLQYERGGHSRMAHFQFASWQ